MQLLLPVRRYLTNRHINVPDDWLTACIDWVISEYAQQNVPFIQDKVYQEWLHADLTELATSCLPPQVTEQASTTISGHFPLQINSVRDISEPAYAQLLKVEGADTENTTVSATQDHRTTWERKAERMLMLELTDGSTVVEGMEYRAAPNLSVSLSPGTKVMVYGSVKVRRGILFLAQHNITVLGGKVMDLLETNDQRNTLIAALNNRDNDAQQQHRGNNDNNTQARRHEEPQTHASTSRPVNTTEPAIHDDDLDFFDDEIFENEFDQDMTLENESTQDPAVEREFAQDLDLGNEFDDDMDAFMSQM